MCASCWNIEPSSTMVLSIFCMVSARLWMYESCEGTARKKGFKKRVMFTVHTYGCQTVHQEARKLDVHFIPLSIYLCDFHKYTPTCSSISWSCMGLVWESISMATSPILLDSSCIRTELSEGRQQAKHTHTHTDWTRSDRTQKGRGEKQKEQRAHTVTSYTRWESQTFQGNTF